ncbi:tetratricopeptide repeat protein [Rhizobium subbaraonis]|uniref:Tetratricopeptide repeat protein n=1 Tax=Rhizobium subbaraonis TaxID=908946 RepID=A0A285UQB1_9HYPH|nr:polysaccharide pyruvyl transferase family protein [Rhizobium subbaraonis]SOC44070.1 tetratricopeptide repeat protein [Rhizobium subbaraonis]
MQGLNIQAPEGAAQDTAEGASGFKPILVSFYCGDTYYYDAAELLRADCRQAGIDYDISELTIPKDFNWAQICKLKVAFFQEMLKKHKRPIFWVDVDCRIRSLPEELRACAFDIAGYVRAFRYVRDFDPLSNSRFWTPSILFFNYNEKVVRFVELMGKIEAEAPGNVTDDYVLQEAWLQFEEQLSVGMLRPETVARTPDDVNERSSILFGSSGNVTEWRSQVIQHDVPRRMPSHQATVLSEVASNIRKEGDLKRALWLYREANLLDPTNTRIVAHYAETLKLLNRKEDALDFLDQAVEQNPDSMDVRQKRISIAVQARKFEKARQAVDELLHSDNEAWRDHGKSLQFDLDLEKRAFERKLRPSQRQRIWWMKTPYPGNFGDILNPYLIEKLTGIPPRYAPRGKGMLCIGSVIKFATTGTIVWGTGTPRMTDVLAPDARYLAVRGPLTRELVLKSGGECPEVFGDPALLLPQLYTPRKVEKKYRLGVIQHVVHRGERNFGPGVKEISIVRCGYEEIEAFIDELCECEMILSTSLHGLIVAHAYGIPARWCTFSDGAAISGDGTKFLDYFLSVQMPEQHALDLSHYHDITASMRDEVPDLQLRFDATALRSSFPSTDKDMPEAE